jgi:hypothetical protein
VCPTNAPNWAEQQTPVVQVDVAVVVTGHVQHRRLPPQGGVQRAEQPVQAPGDRYPTPVVPFRAQVLERLLPVRDHSGVAELEHRFGHLALPRFGGFLARFGIGPPDQPQQLRQWLSAERHALDTAQPSTQPCSNTAAPGSESASLPGEQVEREHAFGDHTQTGHHLHPG